MKNLFYSFILILGVTASVSAQGNFWSETFSGAIPQGWTVVANQGTSDLWTWTDVGATGPYAIPAIASTTAGDGWMIFDSDVLCSGNQDAWLISPVIDCSGQGSVQLRFQQQYRRFFDETFIEISNDGGANWNEIAVNANLGNNDFCNGNPEVVAIDITQWAANQANVKIAFRFLSMGGGNFGCAYSWHIDDVELGSTPANETSISPNSYVTSPSFAIPFTQVASNPVNFGTLIRNTGGNAQTNVTLDVTVTEIVNGVQVFSDAQVLGSLDPGIDSFVVTPNSYTPDGNVWPGIYQASYELTQDNPDFNPTNNTDTTFFVVTDTIFSKVFYNPGTGGIDMTGALAPGGGAQPWKWGVLYDIAAPATAAHVSFAIASNDPSLTGIQMNIGLYEVIDGNGDGFIDDTEIAANQVGFGTYDFTTEASYDIVTTELYDLFTLTPGVAMNANSAYMVALEYNGNAQVFFAQSGSVPYNPFIDLTGSIVRPVEAGGTWYLGGFNSDATPSIVLRINSLPIDVPTVQNNGAVLSVFPNPVSDVLTVNVELEETERFVIYEVTDITGKVLVSERRENVQKETYTINVNQFAAGSYVFTVRTTEGVKSERFVVTK